VICKIPAEARGLPEGVPRDERPTQPAGAVQGKNSWPDGENLGYRGPDPPAGKPHRYYFRLYALDAAMPSDPGITKTELLEAMAGHVIGEGRLMGTYQR
jgi:Raf kinase inhibitor-like YbhB/YbcL family protein